MRAQIHKTATGRTYGLQRRSLYCEPASERFPSSPCFCLSLKAERCARHRIIPSLGPAEFPSPPGRFFCIPAIKPARWAIGQNRYPGPCQCRSLHSTVVPPIGQIRSCRTKKRACSYCSTTALHRRMKFTPDCSRTMLGFARPDSPDRIRAKSPNTAKSQPSGSAFARFSANRASQPEHRPSACCYSPRSQACRPSSLLQLPKTIALNRNDGSGKGAIVASSFDIARLRLAARLSSCNADRLSSARRFPSRNMAWFRSTRGMPPLDEACRRMTAHFTLLGGAYRRMTALFAA